MDSEQAFAVLGLEAPVSAESIRRAYLRSVRRHPPERDADGFRRVREAYDLLRNAPWLWGAKLESVVSPASATVPTPVEPGAQSATPAGPPAPNSQDTAAAADDAAELAPASQPIPPLDRSTRIHRALAENNVQLAAELLMECLTTSLLGAPAQVPVWQVLDVSTRLLEEGEFGRARRLIELLDQRTTALGMGAVGIGAGLAARWMLVDEVLALEHGVADELIRELAYAVRTGDFEPACAVFETLRTNRGWTLDRVLKAKAPRLRKSLRRDVTSRPTRYGFTRWSWLWVVYVALQVMKSYVLPEWHSASLDSARTPSAQVARQDAHAVGPARGVPSSPYPASSAVPAQPPPGAPLEDPANRPLALSARWIDEAVRVGDCSTVRDQWPFYLRAVRSATAPNARAHYLVRRERALAMCAEHAAELSENP